MIVIRAGAYYLCQNCTIDQVAKLIELTTTVEEPGLAPHSSQWLCFGQRQFHSFKKKFSHSTHSYSDIHSWLLVTMVTIHTCLKEAILDFSVNTICQCHIHRSSLLSTYYKLSCTYMCFSRNTKVSHSNNTPHLCVAFRFR